MIKILDTLIFICVIVLGSKYVIQSANTIFDLNLRWYFLEDVPYLSLILTILIFVLYILSEYLKEKSSKAKE
ncbi:hypothetical protein CD148_07020 [Staphylococcus delphini]|uniref:Uncharacterized protein n=1 Tax=Staphylococcus delphini TaxID=53344 RepID=A0AAX0QUM5_9STAP|nr:hypothetical protein [Staphylococcus delphini]PCF49578.1 hypothetical protein B5C07_08520 [Staphylococcus delphini]PNZ94455.1 hypothetical protein CD148_07020 [Staphylococcus delphini]RIZ52070.1 hypothetical protein CDL68_09300 [Staphylococcus delphini]